MGESEGVMVRVRAGRKGVVLRRAGALVGAAALVVGLLPAISASAADSAVACTPWAEGQTYAAGAAVSYDGAGYVALVGHTAYAGTGWNPASTPSLWKSGITCASTPTDPTQPTSPSSSSSTPTSTPSPSTGSSTPTTTSDHPSSSSTSSTRTSSTRTSTTAPSSQPPSGVQCVTPWSSGAVYVGGDEVSYQGANYRAAWWTQGETPGASGEWGAWRLVEACGTGSTTVPTTPTTVPTTPSTVPTTPTTVPTTPTIPAPAAYKPQVKYVPAPADYPSPAQMQAYADQLGRTAGGTANAIELIQRAQRVLPDSEVDQIVPGRAANPENTRRVERIISESTFNQMFPVRDHAYSYVNLLKAVGKFPAYCDTYTDGRDSDAICRKLLATTFAHFVQETGANWASLTPALALDDPAHNNPVLATMDPNATIPTAHQGLWYLREIGMTEDSTRNVYTECFQGPGSPIFSIFDPCGEDANGQYFAYFGRGAKQLSWNYNYGQFSKSLYGDPNVLLDNPSRVADTWLNFASAIWFAVYPQSPKPPMTWVVDGTWVPNDVDRANNMSPGFGATVEIINGGLECGGGGAEKSQVQNRIAAYKAFAAELGVPIPADEQLGCANSKGFTTGSAAATQTYLDMDWSWNPDNASGKSYQCQLVSYQTPFSLANPGDYQACVDYFFRGQVVFNGQVVIDNTK